MKAAASMAGCASCPYMKMNSLAALTETLEMIGGESGQKKNFGLEMREPKKYEGNNVAKEGACQFYTCVISKEIKNLAMTSFKIFSLDKSSILP